VLFFQFWVIFVQIASLAPVLGIFKIWKCLNINIKYKKCLNPKNVQILKLFKPYFFYQNIKCSKRKNVQTLIWFKVSNLGNILIWNNVHILKKFRFENCPNSKIFNFYKLFKLRNVHNWIMFRFKNTKNEKPEKLGNPTGNQETRENRAGKF
jgi:hypothetical protein